MNVRTAITRKEQESDQPSPGGLSWALVHEFNSQHASSVKAAVPYSSNLITAGRTGLQLWDANSGKYAPPFAPNYAETVGHDAFQSRCM